jgi:hypothetical protein
VGMCRVKRTAAAAGARRKESRGVGAGAGVDVGVDVGVVWAGWSGNLVSPWWTPQSDKIRAVGESAMEWVVARDVRLSHASVAASQHRSVAASRMTGDGGWADGRAGRRSEGQPIRAWCSMRAIGRCSGPVAGGNGSGGASHDAVSGMGMPWPCKLERQSWRVRDARMRCRREDATAARQP